MLDQGNERADKQENRVELIEREAGMDYTGWHWAASDIIS
jgi:hypothetical protein